ncbi:MAG: electron transfer flavoprotein subunit beta/FixA family protein [Pseudomonadota bacterium]
MKKAVACYKWVWDDADIRVDEKTRRLDFEKAKQKLSEYDRNAIEAGLAVKNQAGCEFLGVTCGPEVKASLNDVLSRGPDGLYYVEDPCLTGADSRVTAKVLAGIIRKIQDVDLVICGEGSSDEYFQQTGARLAALLGYHSLSCVNRIELLAQGVKVERKLEDGVETVEVSGPAVISVLPDINDPPIPSLKQILAAKKKPAVRLGLEDIGLTLEECRPQMELVSTLGPIVERKRIKMNEEGTSIAEAAGNLIKRLAAEGIIS